MPTVNDIHSGLNATQAGHVYQPNSAAQLQSVVRHAAAAGATLAVCGSRHAMGGQQFATGADLIDTRCMKQVRAFDRARGLLTCDAGIEWPGIQAYLRASQADSAGAWSIRQKQTGANRLTLGGAVASNIHGRGLAMGPFVDDIESLQLVDPQGAMLNLSRDLRADLFAHTCGGYGLTGALATVTLRLAPRTKLERLVDVIDIGSLIAQQEDAVATGCLYGDFQFDIDPASERFLTRGVFARYRPLEANADMPAAPVQLSEADWLHLLALAYTDKRKAFDTYAAHYLRTQGQRYWSDEHQFGVYLEDYAQRMQQRLGLPVQHSLVITELYVPRDRLPAFMAASAEWLRRQRADVVYGTVRFIEQDATTVLPWARQRYACVVFNLNVAHTPAGLTNARDTFAGLIDRALALDGSFYLTYHRHASRSQVAAAYPRFADFLAYKNRIDPEHRFTSDWHRHYQQVFA